MVDITLLQRRIPYALMPVLWLSIHLALHFGNTTEWLRRLCMRFDLVVDDPVSFAEAMDALAPQSLFEDISGSTEPSANPIAQTRDWVERAAQSIPVVASTRTQYWRSLFTHFFAQHHQRQQQSAQDGTSQTLPSGPSQAWHATRALVRFLLPCFTSLFAHYNRMSLVNTIVSYVYSLSISMKPNFFFFPTARWEPLQDVLAAITGAFLTNVVFQLMSGSLTPSGACKQSVSALMKASPALSTLASAASAATIFIQSSLPFLTARSGAAEVRARQTDTTAMAQATAAELPSARLDTTSPRPAASFMPTPHTPHGYLGGGEGVAYALSGFRLGRYHETEQLRGAAWQFVAGIPIRTASLGNDYSIINFIRHRTLPVDVEWSPPELGSGNNNSNSNSGSTVYRRNPPGLDDEGFDVFYATSSSTELYVLINGGSFLTGIALGASWRAFPSVMLWARDHFACVRAVEDYLWPPPPPALWLPRELEEAVPANQQYDKVELVRIEVPASAFEPFPPRALGEPLSFIADGRGEDDDAAADDQEARRSQGLAESETEDVEDAEDEAQRPDGAESSELAASAPHEDATTAAAPHGKESTRIHEDGVTLTLLVPSRCFCPITRSLMHDPVRTQDGFTYDREAITAWLTHHETSPMTNLPLPSPDLVPDMAVRKDVATAVRTFLLRVGPDYVRA